MNIKLLEKELDALYQFGVDLLNYFAYTYLFEDLDKNQSQEYDRLNDEYHSFEMEYQSWYIRSTKIITILLPEKEVDFISYFEPKRTNITEENYSINDFVKKISVRTPDKYKIPIKHTSLSKQVYAQLIQQISILKAIKTVLDSKLYNIKAELRYEIFESEIENSLKLYKNGHLRAAGMLAGVTLESHLLDICKKHGLKSKKKNPSISDYNDLLKSSDKIDVPSWRKIQFLADIRNYCSHKKEREPTNEEIEELIFGVKKMIAEL